VGIIPGPKEPDDLDPYLKSLVKKFKQYGPKGESLSTVKQLRALPSVVTDMLL
jgi:hypothetical protein